MKPIIKYNGGKYKEIKLFLNYIPIKFDRYIEPFVGGGSVYFYINPKKAIINDVNERLINFYKEIKENYTKIKCEIDNLADIYNKNQEIYKIRKKANKNCRVKNDNEELYYLIRDMFNDITTSTYSKATQYFFINRTAFSGMIRYNKNGEFNIPFGRYKSLNSNHLSYEHNILLKRTDIYKGDYSNIFKLANKNDFMFIDPPYDCTFKDYGNNNNFNNNEQKELADNFKKLKCKALMIIGKTELIENLYKGGYIKAEYDKQYSVNVKNRMKDINSVKHLIIANY